MHYLLQNAWIIRPTPRRVAVVRSGSYIFSFYLVIVSLQISK